MFSILNNELDRDIWAPYDPPV